MKNFLIILLVSLSTTINLSAQVVASDSLALVDLFNSTGGSSWKNKTNWLSGNVSSWYGVFINANRVSVLDLRNNKLSGPIPSGFCNLTQLKYLYAQNNNLTGDLPSCFNNLTSLNSIYFTNNNLSGAIPPGIINFPQFADLFISGNHFDELPDLSSLPELSNLVVDNNNFTFEDLIPNKVIINIQYVYAPQDSINSRVDTLVIINDTATFQTFCEGTSNQYQWTKNGISISDNVHFQGTNTPFLTINKLNLADEANFSCTVTNTSLPALSLKRKVVRPTINDTRLSQTIAVVPGSDFTCGDLPLQIIASANSSLPLSYSIISGAAEINIDMLTPYKPGNVTVRIFNTGDDDYKPVQKDTVIQIVSPTNSFFEIKKTIPDNIGEKLELSVPLIPGEDFLWINPQKDSTLSNAYVKSNTKESDEGIYTIKVGKNNCYYFSEKIPVQFSFLHDIVVYELISPNNDGKNDQFYIENIEKYSDNEVLLFNALNQLVFNRKNYQNDWSGEELPEGTYYYVVKVPSFNKLLKGSLYIKK